ncbi:hypothetical protein G6F24_017520 [Rhizopus arrhizus]|nr:hypothetical protein G6F24_017520 [Rhizopus arrhizus]
MRHRALQRSGGSAYRRADGGGERALRAAGGPGHAGGDVLRRSCALRPLRAWTRAAAMPVLLLALAACAQSGQRAAEAGASTAGRGADRAPHPADRTGLPERDVRRLRGAAGRPAQWRAAQW